MRPKKVRGIARDTLRFILEASRSSLPVEFAGLLQVDGEIITEVLETARHRKLPDECFRSALHASQYGSGRINSQPSFRRSQTI